MDQALASRISREIVALLGTGGQIAPFSQRYSGFDLEAAYDVVENVKALRKGRGETPVGRKVGFTNRSIWASLAISAPIWNYVFDRTVHDGTACDSSFRLSDMPEPRIEPELVLHLSSTPTLGMGDVDLLACLDWIAAGFEIVYSIFPGWRFNAADAAAAYGVHGALFVGSKHWISKAAPQSMKEISGFGVELVSDKGEIRTGHAEDVLGGPLNALKYLVEEIARHTISEPLSAGEIVTTGTLTEAMPAVPGVTWTARFVGIDLRPLRLRFD